MQLSTSIKKKVFVSRVDLTVVMCVRDAGISAEVFRGKYDGNDVVSTRANGCRDVCEEGSERGDWPRESIASMRSMSLTGMGTLGMMFRRFD